MEKDTNNNKIAIIVALITITGNIAGNIVNSLIVSGATQKHELNITSKSEIDGMLRVTQKPIEIQLDYGDDLDDLDDSIDDQIDEIVINPIRIDDTKSNNYTVVPLETTNPITYSITTYPVTTYPVTTTSNEVNKQTTTQKIDNNEFDERTLSTLFNSIKGKIKGNYISILVNKSLGSITECLDAPKKIWGINLSNRDINYDVEGDTFLSIDVTMSEDGSPKEAQLYFNTVTIDGYKMDCLDNKIEVTFDGEYYLITGNIDNEYIDVNNINFIPSSYYYDI